MNCPRCKTALTPKIYEANIEVDTCATCGGLWLDKGELERIEETIEHDYSASLSAPDSSPGSGSKALGSSALLHDAATSAATPSTPKNRTTLAITPALLAPPSEAQTPKPTSRTLHVRTVDEREVGLGV